MGLGEVGMNVWHGSGMRWGLAIFGIAMAGLAVWAYWRFGATLLTAVAIGIAIGCFGAMLYAWQLASRSPPQEPTGTPPSQTGKERP